MKVRCLIDSGEALRKYEYSALNRDVLGRFGVTGYSKFGGVTIGKEYLVMGVIIFQTYQAYLIDDDEFISVCPCQLFELIDDKVNSNWNLRIVEKDEEIYPFIQAIFGYYELCADKLAYLNLIVEMDEGARRVYFKRKLDLEL